MKISYLDGLLLATDTFFSISKMLMILLESGSVRFWFASGGTEKCYGSTEILIWNSNINFNMIYVPLHLIAYFILF